MYIFGYKTTLFIQNLYILVNFFGKNAIFRVKSTTFLVFQDQMYILGNKSTVSIQNLYILVKLFGKNFIFRVKSTNVLFFQDQMYIFGYKTCTVFFYPINLYTKCFWVKFFCTFWWIFLENFIKKYKFFWFSVKICTIFWQKLLLE